VRRLDQGVTRLLARDEHHRQRQQDDHEAPHHVGRQLLNPDLGNTIQLSPLPPFLPAADDTVGNRRQDWHR
jgi:hypothetical protein